MQYTALSGCRKQSVMLTCVDGAGGAWCGNIHDALLDINNVSASNTVLTLTNEAGLNHVLQAVGKLMV